MPRAACLRARRRRKKTALCEQASLRDVSGARQKRGFGMENDLKKAYGRLARICSRREYASKDVLSKLCRMGLSESEAASVLEMLKKEGFVDDARYAEAYISEKIRLARWGKRKIRSFLATKRISDDMFEAAYCRVLSDLPVENGGKNAVADGLEKIMKAKHAALSKKYPLPEEMQKIKAALIRFGLGRGYEYDDVYAAACKCCGGKPTLR